jgi:hypothetical protein
MNDTRRAVAKSHAGNYDIDFRTRSVAFVRDMRGQVRFQVVCYGMPHAELSSVNPDNPELSGGTRLARRLERRGVSTDHLSLSVGDTAPMRANWNEEGGRRPGPTGHLKPLHWEDYS